MIWIGDLINILLFYLLFYYILSCECVTHTCVDLWIPNAKISWLIVSANECILSANILCDPVYNHAHNLNIKFVAFLLNYNKNICLSSIT